MPALPGHCGPACQTCRTVLRDLSGMSRTPCIAFGVMWPHHARHARQCAWRSSCFCTLRNRNKLVIHAVPWKNKDIMLDEKSQSQRAPHCCFTYIIFLKIIEIQNKLVIARGEDGKQGEECVWLQRDSAREIFVVMEHLRTWIYTFVKMTEFSV